MLSPVFWCRFKEPGQPTGLRAVRSLQVYLAAGTVYGLEGQLSELEDAARCIHSSTGETELADLEDQVAAAAAQVHHAELQVSPLLSAQVAIGSSHFTDPFQSHGAYQGRSSPVGLHRAGLL